MTRLMLHAGTHKTGTTALQSTLARIRPQLADRNILYPDFSSQLGGASRAHHQFVSTVVHPATGRERAREVRGILDEQISGGRETQVLLSSEAVYRHVRSRYEWRQLPAEEFWPLHLEYLQALALLLHGMEIEVLLVLRRPDAFAVSLYSEFVMNGVDVPPFEDWLPSAAPMLDYDRQIVCFTQAFNQVTTVRYEDLCAGGLEESFLRLVGVEGVNVPRRGRTRQSAEVRVLLWMREQRLGAASERHSFVRSRIYRELLDTDELVRSLWSSTDARNDFLASLDGDHGASYWPAPTDEIVPALLDEATSTRIAEGWLRWKQGGGLPE